LIAQYAHDTNFTIKAMRAATKRLAVLLDTFFYASRLEINTKLVAFYVATLALGSRPRQKGCKGAGQEEARESHHILPGV
jgi:hypothetical protein